MLNKILALVCFFTICMGFSQTVDYHGRVESNSSTEYLVTITSITSSINSFSEFTLAKEFIFKNIPVGYYKRCTTNNDLLKCDTIKINNNVFDDVIRIENEGQIKEVVIRGQKPLIRNNNGILVINIGGSPILSNGTAFETLSKLPGITFNYPNNSFSLKGKSGIQIQVDGKTLNMSNNEVMDYLKNISSSDIDDIEINSSPSAKYDASGSGGVINIKTKKIIKQGYYLGASFNGTQGKYYKQNTGIKGQYNTKKNRYTFHYINSFNTDFEKANTYREFSDTHTEQNTHAKIKGNTNTINAQYEHEYSNSNLLINSSLSFYNERISQETDLNFYNQPGLLSSTLNSNQISKNNLKNFDTGVNYTINGEKSKLIFKSNYVFYNIENNSNLSTKQNPLLNIYNDLQNESPNKINIAFSQIDYELKLDSLSKFEIGAKAIYQNINSKNNFYESMNSFALFDQEKSNEYQYREWIFGGYTQYSRNFDKMSFVIGSRIEYNPLKGFDKKNNYTLSRDNVNFFPFINFSYNLSENNNFSISYNKRIFRPSYKNLMPFVYYVDQYTRLIGNSELKPGISHQLELQYILKNKYSFSITYSVDKNQIYQTPIQNNEDTSTILTPTNINKSTMLSFSSNLSFQPAKWWELNVNGIFSYNKLNDNMVNIASDIWSGQLVTSNVFSLPKALKLELTTNYSTPFIQGPYKTLDLFTTSLGISKSFYENRLKVSLVGNDIFRTYTVKNRSIIENQVSRIIQNFDTHWIRLGLVYKLTKGIKKRSSESDKLTEELKSRAQ